MQYVTRWHVSDYYYYPNPGYIQRRINTSSYNLYPQTSPSAPSKTRGQREAPRQAWKKNKKGRAYSKWDPSSTPSAEEEKKQRTPRNMLEIPAVLETSSYTAISPFGATRVRVFGLRHPVYSSYSYIRMIDVLQPFKAVQSLVFFF